MNAALEQLRLGNPAARALPLLQTLALRRFGSRGSADGPGRQSCRRAARAMNELPELIPHAGSMCLLDRVVAHSEHDIECTARSHTSPDHPLRRDGQLSALHLVEYAAQAMAAHGALVSGGVQRGMLAAAARHPLARRAHRQHRRGPHRPRNAAHRADHGIALRLPRRRRAAGCCAKGASRSRSSEASGYLPPHFLAICSVISLPHATAAGDCRNPCP